MKERIWLACFKSAKRKSIVSYGGSSAFNGLYNDYIRMAQEKGNAIYNKNQKIAKEKDVQLGRHD